LSANAWLMYVGDLGIEGSFTRTCTCSTSWSRLVQLFKMTRPVKCIRVVGLHCRRPLRCFTSATRSAWTLGAAPSEASVEARAAEKIFTLEAETGSETSLKRMVRQTPRQMYNDRTRRHAGPFFLVFTQLSPWYKRYTREVHIRCGKLLLPPHKFIIVGPKMSRNVVPIETRNLLRLLR